MTGPQPFRVEPQAGPEAYKTYQIVAPVSTHYREATCREVECPNWAGGFRSRIDVSTDLGVRQARHIEGAAGRRYTRAQTGSIVTYDFPPGQRCFTVHRVALEREPLYVVRDGDHRGNPRGTIPVRRGATEWLDDFAGHQQSLAERIEKG